MKSLIATSLVALSLAGAVCAQYPMSWAVTPGVSGTPPWTRENPGVASKSHMYQFGGRTGNSGGVLTNALWEFDGTTWVQRTANGAVGSPPERNQSAICWDYGRDLLVVFGGVDALGNSLNDTWEWNPTSNTWAQATGPAPSARTFSAMAWDPSGAVGDIVLFGGVDATNTHLNDTWAYISGFGWVQLNPANSPSVRRQHSMMTRLDSGDILLCAGQDASLAAPAKWRTDVWTWNGLDWTLIPTTNTPASVVSNQAVYDLLRRKVVMIGGNGIAGGSPTSQLSEFDTVTNDWTVYGYATVGTADPVIGRISRYFAAYLPSTGKIYKVGGQNPSGTGAAPATTCEYGIGYPGNGADLDIRVSRNGAASTKEMVQLASAGVPFSVISLSPGATLDGQPFALAATVFSTGTPPTGFSTTGGATPDLWIDLSNFLFLFDGLTGGGPAASLVPGGVTLGPITSNVSLVGLSAMLQIAAIVPGPTPTLGLSDATEVRFIN